MQVDFFVIKYPNGERKICELATNHIIYVRVGESFGFNFETEVVRCMLDKFGDNQMEYTFLKKV